METARRGGGGVGNGVEVGSGVTVAVPVASGVAVSTHIRRPSSLMDAAIAFDAVFPSLPVFRPRKPPMLAREALTVLGPTRYTTTVRKAAVKTPMTIMRNDRLRMMRSHAGGASTTIGISSSSSSYSSGGGGRRPGGRRAAPGGGRHLACAMY